MAMQRIVVVGTDGHGVEGELADTAEHDPIGGLSPHSGIELP